MSGDAKLASGPLVMVGGYGLVGGQAATLLRERNPQLPLVLAGRNPARASALAAALDATTARVDVRSERPLATLAERPAAILATTPDPADRLLAEAMREGIPIADVDRADAVATLDALLHASRERPRAPVLLAGAWKGGTAALLTAALARLVPSPTRIDLAVVVSSRDRVGDGAWRFSRRWAWPHYASEDRVRGVGHPFTDVRPVRCADGQMRPSVRISTLDQVALPMSLDVPTVEVRLAMLEAPKLWAVVALKRSGALRALERPRLRGVRRRLLERSGGGDLSAFTVTVTGADRTLAIDAIDMQGQAHLGAVGAALAAERVLGLADVSLPAGVSFPEQNACPAADIAALTAAGVVLRPHGCTLAELAAAGEEPSVPLEPILEGSR
ncbi:MAG TPA: hypothetical protein VN635_15315 [Conexibacter sp.]|nr:hypothetical protein [Conexibacter sp.]